MQTIGVLAKADLAADPRYGRHGKEDAYWQVLTRPKPTKGPRGRPAWHGQRVCGAHPPALPRAAEEGAVSGAQRCSAAQRPCSRSPLHARSGAEHRAPLSAP